ncbi:MAG: polyprenyl synthetase family protein [Tepidanaerobacteraceae bacterium]|nr:polyprenyl synthetase family protein [Tepidanaerobacteraceae bacterium]
MHKLIPGELENELKILDDELKRGIHTKIHLINKPLFEMVGAGGKRLRPVLVLASARFGRYDFEKTKPLAVAVELIHTATLVHDDIVDDSPLRRGIPSIQARLGKDVAVFAGDFIFCKVFELLTSMNNLDILRRISRVMYKICEGEMKQREDLYNTDVTFRNYVCRIQRKTALLFGLSCELGAASCGAHIKVVRALNQYGVKLGIAFQLIDDLLDVTCDEYDIGKPGGADIREGVITLPVIYALQKSLQKDELRYILQKQKQTVKDTETALEIVRDSGGVEYTRWLAGRYVEKAAGFLKNLPDIPMKKVLANIAEYIYNRKN